MAKDHVSSAIKQHLAPVLAAVGFTRYKPKHFVRVRGELVDSIGFQMSQYGGRDFYVHRYVNFLSDPGMNINSYCIGDRIDRPPARDVEWAGPTEESASAALKSVAMVAKTEILPWFDSIATTRDFIVAYVASPSTKLEAHLLSVALLRLGETNRPWWNCHALKDRATYVEPFDEHDQQTMSIAVELEAALDTGGHLALLNQWKASNVAKFGLEQLVA